MSDERAREVARVDAVLHVITAVVMVAVGVTGYVVGRDEARREAADHFWKHCMDEGYWGRGGPDVTICGWELPKYLGYEDPRRR